MEGVIRTHDSSLPLQNYKLREAVPPDGYVYWINSQNHVTCRMKKDAAILVVMAQ